MASEQDSLQNNKARPKRHGTLVDYIDPDQRRRTLLENRYGLTGGVGTAISGDFTDDFLAQKQEIINKWFYILEPIIAKVPFLPIHTAICLGLDSMYDAQPREGQDAVYLTLAAFRGIVDTIRELQKDREGRRSNIKCVYHDVGYTSADARLLEAMDGEVANTEDLPRHIGSGTLIVNMGSGSHALLNILFAKTTPGYYMGHDSSDNHDLLAGKQMISLPKLKIGWRKIFKGAALWYPSSPVSPTEVNLLATLSKAPPKFAVEHDLISARSERIARHHQTRTKGVLRRGPVHYIDPKTLDQTRTHLETKRAAMLLKQYNLTGVGETAISTTLLIKLMVTKKSYLNDATWQPFRNQIEQALDVAKPDNIVCLGLGSLFAAVDEKGVHDFIHELALVMAIRDLVAQSRRRHQGIWVPIQEIPLVFQEPRLRPADIRLLQHYGGKVCAGNDGIKLVKKSTLVFAKGMRWDMGWDLLLRNTKPAALVGTNVECIFGKAMAAAFVDDDAAEMSYVDRVGTALLDNYGNVVMQRGVLNGSDADHFLDGLATTRIHWKKGVESY